MKVIIVLADERAFQRERERERGREGEGAVAAVIPLQISGKPTPLSAFACRARSCPLFSYLAGRCVHKHRSHTSRDLHFFAAAMHSVPMQCRNGNFYPVR
jgi:hypothetical protein